MCYSTFWVLLVIVLRLTSPSEWRGLYSSVTRLVVPLNQESEPFFSSHVLGMGVLNSHNLLLTFYLPFFSVCVVTLLGWPLVSELRRLHLVASRL